jgi:hypothetical protein
MAFFHTVREIEHYDVFSLGTLVHEVPNKHPREWMKHALITIAEATEVYMVEVKGESHCLKQPLMSCTFSTCLQLWQGKEFEYSRKSPICTWL